jgi:threonine aldolase
METTMSDADAINRASAFASDNNAGMCPEALAALTEANHGACPAYGEDRFTAAASDRIRDLFETDCEVFFTFNGTAANSLALATLCRSYHSVICAGVAHIETDECGAPEFFTNGTKILLAHSDDGKVHAEQVEEIVHRRSDVHYPKPRALSITQATELGTVYTSAELKELGAIAHGLGLGVHMDGARFTNALVELGCSPKDISWKVGVDVLCFGTVKNGSAIGEAVLFFNKQLAEEFSYRCKQAGQLASKMRYLSAPLLGLLEGDTWLRNARQANHCAKRLYDGVKNLDGVTVLVPRQANSVFLGLPPAVRDAVAARGWHFYTFIGQGGVRLMCSWQTTEAEVDAFIADLIDCLDG